jgi:hypothetical protein
MSDESNSGRDTGAPLHYEDGRLMCGKVALHVDGAVEVMVDGT